jgi:hypothetical protein
MAPIVSTVEIARPPEEVFAYATNLSRFSEWQEGVVLVPCSCAGTPRRKCRSATAS